MTYTLQWHHNGRDSVSNHQLHDCLLNRLSDANQRKQQNSASLAFVRGIHRGPVNSPHKWPVTQKMFPFFYDVIMHIFAVLHIWHIPRSMHTIRVLWCLIWFLTGQIYPYHSGLLHWHCGTNDSSRPRDRVTCIWVSKLGSRWFR